MRYIIPDIHGCLKTLIALIDKINLSGSDSIYFLGDYIDRGTNSSGVLDYLIKLNNQFTNSFFLMGNHEFNLIETEKKYDKGTFNHFVSKINKSKDLLNKNYNIKKEYKHFIESELKYFIELKDAFLVHAGFNTLNKPFNDKISMLEIRAMQYDMQIYNNKYIIHGHQPTYINEIKNKINHKSKIIQLDNGCVYTKKHKIYDYTQLGHLCCLNLNTFELITQKNIE